MELTKDETSALVHCVKHARWSSRVGLQMFLRRHPELTETPEMRALAVGVGRTPFPNIVGKPEGPFPVFKDRPFYDARMWDSPEQRAFEAEMEEAGLFVGVPRD